MRWYRRVITSEDGTEIIGQIMSDFAALGSPKEMMLVQTEHGGGGILYLRMPARLTPVYDGFSETSWGQPPGGAVRFLVGDAEEFDQLIAGGSKP